jgi:acetylornithine aminotransferase
MYQQAQKLVHCSNLYHNDQAGELACTLVNLTRQFGGLGYPPLADSSSASAYQESPQDHKVFFANSGAEANVI